MESKNLMDYDSDDTELIEAEGMNECAKKRKQLRNLLYLNCNSWWKLGDICRAVYCGDQLYHEAKIVHIQRKFCLVQFLDNDEPTQSHILCPKRPHMPQNSACAIDPHLYAMVTDCYRAGYYTV
ncbi:hypothetical protein CEXT_260371 [Caerostris extrusa]|uniref:Uncharacterized protein n=1 Tax=Caerostris extrusa TaxID=172846 RepID=A0AAV4SV54_CAEEX|nr:hypothetical protein CEXT_260371 [Caerostris extrusa]